MTWKQLTYLSTTQKFVCFLLAANVLISVGTFLYTIFAALDPRQHDRTSLVLNIFQVIIGSLLLLSICIHAIVTQNGYLILTILWAFLLSSAFGLVYAITLYVVKAEEYAFFATVNLISCALSTGIFMVCVFLVMWRVQHEFQWKIYEVIGAGLEQRTICRQFYKMQAVGAINMLLAHNNMVGYLWTAFLTENEPGAMDKSVVLTVRELYLAVFACTILVYFAAGRGGRKNQLKWMVFAMVGLVGQLALVGVLIRMMHIYQPQAQASPILSGIVALVAFYYTTRSMLNLKKGLGTVLAGQEVLYQQRAHKMDLD